MKNVIVPLRKISVPVGEIWTDSSGNECYYRENGTISVTTINNEPSLAIQSEKDSCDIAKIVAKFQSTGILTNFRQEPPQYGDFTNVCDYATAVQRVQEAENAFMSLDANIRARFKNNPQELLTFLQDDKNRAEAIQLGLIPKPKADSGSESAKPASGATQTEAGKDSA